MAEKEVEIVIGARTDGLIKGVAQTNAALQSIQGQVNRVTSGFGQLAAIIGVSFSVHGLISYIESMGKLGEETERTMARLGGTAEMVTRMEGVAKVTGIEMAQLTSSFERMTMAIKRSGKDPLSEAAQGLKLLGLSAKDFQGLNFEQYFIKLSEAVSKFNPGMELNNALMAVGGRAVARLIPTLRLGADGFKDLGEKVSAAQAGLARAIPETAKVDDQLDILKISVQSFGARIFNVLQPAISSAIEWMTKFVQSMSEDKLRGIIRTIGDYALSFLQTIGHLVISIDEQIQNLSGSASGIKGTLERVAGFGVAGGIIGVLGGPAGVVGGALVGGTVGLLSGGDEATEEVKKRTADLKAAFEERHRMLDDKIKAEKEKLDALLSTVAGGAGEGDGSGLKTAGSINVNAREELQFAVTSIQTQIQMSKGLMDQNIARYELDAQYSLKTEQQKIAAIKAAIEKHFELEHDRLKRIRDMQPTPQEKAAAHQQVLAAEQQHALKMIQLNGQMVMDIKAQWSLLTDAFTSSWASSMGQLIAGTMSFKEAFRSSMAAVSNAFFQEIARMVAKWASKELTELTLTVMGEKAKTAAATEGAAERSGLTAIEAIKAIGNSVAQIFAELTAWLVPVFGPAAPAVAIGIAGGVGAAAYGMIKGFDTGSWSVPQDMVAMVHAGERITPAGVQGGGWQDGRSKGGEGGGGATIIINAVDARSVAAWAQDHAGALAGAVAGYQRVNPSSRGRF